MSLSRRLSALARFGLYALLVWAPIPLGSNRPIFWAINGLLASLVLLLFVAGEGSRATRTAVDWPALTLLAGGLGLLAAWIALQSARWTPAVLHHPAWTDFALDPAAPPRGAISANPAAGYASLAAFLPFAFLAVFAARIAFDAARARFLLRLVVLSALFLAIYGLLAQNLELPQVLLIERNGGPDAFTSFFVNRNTAATYLAIGLVATFALIGEKYEKLGSSAARIGLGRGLVELPRLAGFDLLAAFVLTTALTNTASRAGIFSAGAGMLAVALMARLHGSGKLGRGSRHKAAAVSAVLLVLAVFLTGLALAGGLFFQRLEETPLDLATRFALYRDTIEAILARPLLGHGAGAFADIFPLFHSEAVSSTVIWNRAHNVYLQAAAELGLPAFVALVAFILWWLASMIAPVQARSRPAPVAIAAIGAAVVVAIHSLFDFSLQIQAVALLLLVIAGAGFGEARRLGEPPASREGRSAGRGVSGRGEFEVRDLEIPLAAPPPAPAENRSNFP